MVKKVVGIYVIQSVCTCKVYVGSSNDVLRRWSVHLSLLKNNKHKNEELQKDFNEYGESYFSFKVVEECNQRDLYENELKWINKYDREDLYNKRTIINTHKKIRRGKEASNYREIWSAKNTGDKNPNCKYTVEQIKEVKKMINNGDDVKDIAARFNMTQGYIYLIRGGYKWASVQTED